MPILPQEIWISRFATELTQQQPKLDRLLAQEVGAEAWQDMKMLKPEKAVTDFLHVSAQRQGVSRLAFNQRDIDQFRIACFLLDAEEDPGPEMLRRFVQLGWLILDPNAHLGLAAGPEGQKHLA